MPKKTITVPCTSSTPITRSCHNLPLDPISWQADFSDNKRIPQKWDIETWPAKKFNNELQRYTRDPSNLFTQDNHLHIRGLKNPSTQELTSARLTTQHNQYFSYGSIHIRARLPLQQGTWPAIWLLGKQIHHKGWPGCGEIDIMEHINTEAQIQGSAHDAGHCWKTAVKNKHFIIKVDDLTQAHDYGLTWTPDFVEWSLDGQPYGRLHKANYVAPDQPWAYDDDQFLILNLALGGDWPQAPNPDFEQADMVVESIHYRPLNLKDYGLWQTQDQQEQKQPKP